MKEKKIGEKLLALRTKAGLTQQELSDAIDVTVSAIGMYERNERIPRDEIKIRLARFFKVTVDDLFF